MKKLRRLEGKTDYKARAIMLKYPKARIIFRKTNRYLIGQFIKTKESQDFVVTGVISKDLLNYGVDKKASGSLKSISVAYLTGFLLGKKINDKEDKPEAIFDIGLIRNVKGSRAYSFLKGVIDAGVKVNAGKEVFPEESRLLGRHMKNNLEIEKIKSEIEKRFK